MNTSYAYIYDDFLSDKRFEREVAAFETRLNSYDLAGRVGRLSLFRSARDLVEGLVRQGVTTVVIVGNDGTLDKTMWFLPDLPVTVGYIPLVGPSATASLMGIPEGSQACDVLAARLIETFDMGRLDNRYFLTEIAFPVCSAVLDVEGRYTISPVNGGSMAIRNLGGRLGNTLQPSDPKDGMLEAVIIPNAQEKRSFFSRAKTELNPTSILFRGGVVTSRDPVEAMADNHTVSGFRFTVTIVPEKLRLITGRGRRRPVEVSAGLPKRGKNGNFRPRRA